jgi:hypothetical protein
MAKNNRDDFSPSTIKAAGERVGLLCSFCGCLTKAASAESEKKVSSIGVAAHICAASPGGPRYDPSMTVDERKSIENCIWMCETHARLIDTDVVSYPRERLLQMKKTAEERTRKALEEGRSSFNFIESSGFEIAVTKEILEESIKEGNYSKLKNILNFLEHVTKTAELQDLYDYYKIVYLFYCDRTELIQMLEYYKSKSTKRYINDVIELFISFNSIEYLSIIIEQCENNELKSLADYILNKNLDKIIIKEQDLDGQTSKKIVLGGVLHRLATNYALENGITALKDVDGNVVSLYSNEFYYKQKMMLTILGQEVYKFYSVKEQKLSDYLEYRQFENGLENIKLLAPQMQLGFWSKLLSIASAVDDKFIYEKVESECNESLRENVQIQHIIWLNRIDKNIETVDFNDIRKLCDLTNDYTLSHAFFNKATSVIPNMAEKIINSHRYFLTTDCLFLDDYIKIKQARNASNFSPVKFLLEYRTTYENNLDFHILLAFYSAKNKKFLKTFQKEAKWINENLKDYYLVSSILLDKLIVIYNKTNCNYKLIELSKIILPIHFRMHIAGCLFNSNEFKTEAKNIYEDIKKENSHIIGLNRCLFACYYDLGDMTSAKKCLCDELDFHINNEDLCNLLTLRLETKELVFDKYFEQAKEIVDAKVFHLIGVTYLEAKKCEEAKIYLMKSLLMNPNDLDCLNAFMSVSLTTKDNGNPKIAEAGVTVTLKKERGIIKVSLHSDSLIVGFRPTKLANSFHYVESDKAVEDIFYRKVGDMIQFRNKEYEIIALAWTDAVIFNYSMHKLVESKRAYAIRGNSVEDGINNLIKWLEERKAHLDDIVKIYNNSNGCVPISMFSSKLGKKILETYCFIFYENNKRLRNLEGNIEVDPNNEFILSFDAIYLLAILDVDLELLKQKNCKTSIMTKRIMLAEVNEFIHDSKNGANVGQIFLKDKTVYRSENTQEYKRGQLNFFNRLKRILDILETPIEQYSYPYKNDITTFFAKEKLQLEGDLIGYANQCHNAVLVNDDPFISNMINLHCLKGIGMNKFLTLLGLDVLKHLECVKMLAQLNFGNYITKDVYKSIKDLIVTEKDEEKQKNAVNLFVDFLTSKFLTEGSDNWKYNNYIVQEIMRSNNISTDTTDWFDYLVIRAITYNYSREYPEEFKKHLEYVKKRFRVKSYIKDGEVIIETYMADDESE